MLFVCGRVGFRRQAEIREVEDWRGRARRIPERISTLDVLPTLLDLLGEPAPRSLRGRSLLPLMRGELLPEEPILAEGYPFGRSLQSVTLGRFKLIRSLETGSTELYDLESDPGEHSDLASSHPDEEARLAVILDGQLGGRPVTTPDMIQQLGRLPEDTRKRLQELGYID